MLDESPTARALLALELVQSTPGVTARRLSDRLGVSERAARRYIGILREAGVPIESTRGPHGGYRVGRGLRLPPLMFTQAEAVGLVMALLETQYAAGEDDDPVTSALGKVIRVLPAPVAGPAEQLRRASARTTKQGDAPDPETTTVLAEASLSRRAVRLRYRLVGGREREMDVDPWAVVVRHEKWYVLCWSHAMAARRTLRIDRVASVEVLDRSFEPPPDLDPVRELEDQMSQGWTHEIVVVVDAPVAQVARWMPRSMGRCEAIDARHTRLTGSTDEPDWYACQLTRIQAPFRVLEPAILRAEVEALGRRLLGAVVDQGPGPD